MILGNSTSNRLSWRAGLAVLVLGGLALVLSPTWATAQSGGKGWPKADAAADLKKAEYDVAKAHHDLRKAVKKLESARSSKTEPKKEEAPKWGDRFGKGGPWGGKAPEIVTLPDGRKAMVLPDMKDAAPKAGAQAPSKERPAAGADRRAQDLSQRMDRLLKEVEALRRELRR